MDTTDRCPHLHMEERYAPVSGNNPLSVTETYWWCHDCDSVVDPATPSPPEECARVPGIWGGEYHLIPRSRIPAFMAAQYLEEGREALLEAYPLDDAQADALERFVAAHPDIVQRERDTCERYNALTSPPEEGRQPIQPDATVPSNPEGRPGVQSESEPGAELNAGRTPLEERLTAQARTERRKVAGTSASGEGLTAMEAAALLDEAAARLAHLRTALSTAEAQLRRIGLSPQIDDEWGAYEGDTIPDAVERTVKRLLARIATAEEERDEALANLKCEQEWSEAHHARVRELEEALREGIAAHGPTSLGRAAANAAASMYLARAERAEKALEAAQAYIKASPCDPDITTEQTADWAAYGEAWAKYVASLRRRLDRRVFHPTEGEPEQKA